MRRHRQRRTKEDYIELTEQIKRLPILEIWERYVGGQVRMRGHRAVAVCPFHAGDRSPSLTLYTEKNNWYCYGCQKGGTTIDLVMKQLNLDFKNAAAALARDFGLSDWEPNPETQKKLKRAKESRTIALAFEKDYDRIFKVLLSVRSQFHQNVKTFEDFEANMKLANDMPIIESYISQMADACSGQEKLELWRAVRRRFPWLKTTI